MPALGAGKSCVPLESRVAGLSVSLWLGTMGNKEGVGWLARRRKTESFAWSP